VVSIVFCFDGSVHVLKCATDAEFHVERWNRRGRVMEGVVNGLVLVAVFLVLLIYYYGTPVNKTKPFLILCCGVYDL
jgi:hypothetical protein